MVFNVSETTIEKGQSYLRVTRNFDSFNVYLECEGTNSQLQLEVYDIESALQYAVIHSFPVKIG